MNYDFLLEQATLNNIKYVEGEIGKLETKIGECNAEISEWQDRLYALKKTAGQQRQAAEDEAIREDRRAQ